MMTSNLAFIIFIVLSFSSVYSFGLAPRRVRQSSAFPIKMTFGLQKLGQPVINIQTVAPPVPETGSLFGRKQQTNGNDERIFFGGNSITSDDLKEQQYEELASLDMNFKKQSLLMGLSSQWSQAEKIERINIAASIDGLLPSSFASSVTTVSMKAGGLTNEWDFDFGN